MSFHGWAGTLLSVDLTSGKINKEELQPEFAERFLGASGFNSAALFNLVSPEADALSPENVLMLGAGPLSGTLAPGSARTTVTAKSPLTDAFGDSNMGGYFAAELKLAGYDQIRFFGKADRPVYLLIDDDRVEIRDASHVWGKSTWETAQQIREDVCDPDAKVVCIGPAGENLVRFANILQPTTSAAGRFGMGAVMGSKNLKAVAVRGSGNISVARPREFVQACAAMREYVAKNSPNLVIDRETGSPGLTDLYHPKGILGVRNFQRNILPNWEDLSGKVFVRDYAIAHKGCSACFVGCGHFHSVRSGEFAGLYGQGPEFGMISTGIACDITNFPAILKIHQLFNLLGMDCYGGQHALAWAMECFERGIVSEKELDGIPLRFGDYHACIEMIPRIATRQGFGRVLGEGYKRAPQIVGRGSEKYMYHVKGLGPIATDPRGDKQMGLQFLTSPRGADHLKALNRAMAMIKHTPVGQQLWGDPETLDRGSAKGKGLMVRSCEDMVAAVNASGTCLRTCGSVSILSEIVSSATGIEYSQETLLQTGERIFNVQKAFNARQGLDRKDDNFSVPHKFLTEPISEGPRKGSTFERDLMLDEYYVARGWDKKTGLQTKAKLVELGLEDVAEELVAKGAAK